MFSIDSDDGEASRPCLTPREGQEARRCPFGRRTEGRATRAFESATLPFGRTASNETRKNANRQLPLLFLSLSLSHLHHHLFPPPNLKNSSWASTAATTSTPRSSAPTRSSPLLLPLPDSPAGPSTAAACSCKRPCSSCGPPGAPRRGQGPPAMPCPQDSPRDWPSTRRFCPELWRCFRRSGSARSCSRPAPTR